MDNNNELLKTISENERVVVVYKDIDHNIVYVVTEHIRGYESYLYKVKRNKLIKIETCDKPYFEEPENFLKKEQLKLEKED